VQHFILHERRHYKEDIAGETMGYIPVRAETTQKHPTQVLVEMVEEAGELRMRIVETLKGEPEALAAWKACERGFMYVTSSFVPWFCTDRYSQRVSHLQQAVQTGRSRVLSSEFLNIDRPLRHENIDNYHRAQ
jgi:hypothetical protein